MTALRESSRESISPPCCRLRRILCPARNHLATLKPALLTRSDHDHSRKRATESPCGLSAAVCSYHPAVQCHSEPRRSKAHRKLPDQDHSQREQQRSPKAPVLPSAAIAGPCPALPHPAVPRQSLPRLMEPSSCWDLHQRTPSKIKRLTEPL